MIKLESSASMISPISRQDKETKIKQEAMAAIANIETASARITWLQNYIRKPTLQFKHTHTGNAM